MNKPSCPCGSKQLWKNCCLPFIENIHKPENAEQLMRSRYSAYTTHNMEYLIHSTHPDTRKPLYADAGNIQEANTQWRQLQILNTSLGGPNDLQGEVEFTAFYIEQGQLKQLHEHSLFIKTEGRWLYHSGQQLPPIKLERNRPCPCSSGRKYKKCCGH
jgi:SEC-C motif-containing protein